jgi:hypothetical protein
MNAEQKDGLGVSPAQLLFGNALQLDKGILLPHVTMEDKEQRLTEWSSKMLSRQHRALFIAKETQHKRDDEHMKYVLVEYFTGPPSKLHPILKGPLRVVNHVGSTYSLQSLIDDRIEDYHISLLRPYLEDSFFQLTPSAVANRDDQLWVVEKILNIKEIKQNEDRYNSRLDGKIMVLIKTNGYLIATFSIILHFINIWQKIGCGL